MIFSVYYINAFTDKVFCGNPAAVCMLSTWPTADVLHAIAKENNLPVTAFLIREQEGFGIRWVTPDYELDLCGHGLLAAGYVVLDCLGHSLQNVCFRAGAGQFRVSKKDQYIVLDFPEKSIEEAFLPILEEGLGLAPKIVFQHALERCMAVYDAEEDIRKLIPNMNILKRLGHRGVIVTAPGNDADFVSRTFYPKKPVTEDHATGASHCLLVPYWAKRLKKHILNARQLSQRGGEMLCHYYNERVLIHGKAMLYMQGVMMMPC